MTLSSVTMLTLEFRRRRRQWYLSHRCRVSNLPSTSPLAVMVSAPVPSLQGVDAVNATDDRTKRGDGEIGASGGGVRAVLRKDAGRDSCGGSDIAMGGDGQGAPAVVAGVDAALAAGDAAIGGGTRADRCRRCLLAFRAKMPVETASVASTSPWAVMVSAPVPVFWA